MRSEVVSSSGRTELDGSTQRRTKVTVLVEPGAVLCDAQRVKKDQQHDADCRLLEHFLPLARIIH